MIFAPLVALSLAAGSLATPTKRESGLVVSVSSNQAKVKSVDDLVLTAKVENKGSEAVKVLKYATILDEKTPSRSFRVSKDGSDVAFKGVKVNVDLQRAGDNAYTVIPAGKSVEVKHSVSSLFDFASAGTGSFTFEPITAFQTVDDSVKASKKVGALVNLQSNSNSVTVDITNDVAKRFTMHKRAEVNCTTDQADFISSAYKESKELASIAADYIGSNGDSELVTSYFKTNPASEIGDRFSAVANENDADRTLSCADPYDVCDGNVIAYTLIETTNIYFCDIFYNEVATGELCSGTTVNDRNIRAGTVLHETTHAISGTDDVTYGCPADQALSADQQLINADNYNCFSTQVYADTQC